jgi:excisionase family DNA binding protein
MTEPKLLTREEVAERLKVSLRTVDRHREAGRLSTIRIAGSNAVRCLEDEVDALLIEESVSE